MSFTSEGRELIEIIEDMGLDTRSYSGRGMFGKKCIAFTTNHPLRDVGLLGIALAESSLSDMGEDILGKISSDNMGLSTIIYFPRIEYLGGNEERTEEK